MIARVPGLAALCAALLAGEASAMSPGLPPFGLGAFEREEPISITADALEARDDGGQRTIAFRRRVEVQQGSLRLSAQMLEAVYAAGQSQPDRLIARGGVVIREGTRRALCVEARYDRPARKILCRGEPAELWDGADRLSGEKIAFDLARHSVRVERNTELQIHRDLAELDFSEASPDPEVMERVRGKGPVTIRADALAASDPEGQERRIQFSGSVVLRQGDIELRAQELEAVYLPGASQPDRLIARRDVVLTESEREARCQLAEYVISKRRITCEGDAELRDRQDRLQGDRIAFDFGARQVDAVGSARLSVATRRAEEPR